MHRNFEYRLSMQRWFCAGVTGASNPRGMSIPAKKAPRYRTWHASAIARLLRGGQCMHGFRLCAVPEAWHVDECETPIMFFHSITNGDQLDVIKSEVELVFDARPAAVPTSDPQTRQAFP